MAMLHGLKICVRYVKRDWKTGHSLHEQIDRCSALHCKDSILEDDRNDSQQESHGIDMVLSRLVCPGSS